MALFRMVCMLLDVRDSLQLLDRYRLAYPKTALCEGKADVLDQASGMAFPLVLKASSRQQSHKTEKGLVQLGIRDLDELAHAFDRLAYKSRHFELDAFVVQEQAHGAELMVGALRDSVFGPSVLFGLGGVLTELLQETAVRVCPLAKRDAQALLSETKARIFFQNGGFRGKKASAKPVLDVLLKTSKLMEKESVESLDFNPVMADEKKALIVDPRIVVQE
ncbi:acetate--CoA ligase family protein [Candidatus Micrarchaeota archaeon]|nr:acetate--CoA ligase family protein [Candidatus Micrarchaeota archaeon]